MTFISATCVILIFNITIYVIVITLMKPYNNYFREVLKKKKKTCLEFFSEEFIYPCYEYDFDSWDDATC